LPLAQEAFTRAVQNNPKSSRAHAGLGVAAMQSGNRDQAFEQWRRAVDLDPRNFDALYNLAAELVNAGRMSEARPYIDRFVNTAPPGMYGPDIERLREMTRRQD
jgi:Flp pilus assembly protein TadD